MYHGSQAKIEDSDLSRCLEKKTPGEREALPR